MSATAWAREKGGYTPAFLTLAGIALVALVLFWFLMPETKNENTNAAAAGLPQPQNA